MKVGIASIGFLGYNLTASLLYLSRLGYEGLELIYYPESWSTHVPSPEDLRSSCDSYGVEICSFRFIVDDTCASGDGLEKILDLAMQLSSPMIDVKIVSPSEDMATTDDFERAAGRLRMVRDRARSRGMKVSVETHPGVVHSSCRGTLKLIDLAECDDVTVNYDQANLAYAGKEDVDTALSILGTRIGYVHLKNGWFGGNRPVWSTLKYGSVDNLKLIRGLLRTGYDGYLTVEKPGGGEPFTWAGEDIAYIGELIELAEKV